MEVVGPTHLKEFDFLRVNIDSLVFISNLCLKISDFGTRVSEFNLQGLNFSLLVSKIRNIWVVS